MSEIEFIPAMQNRRIIDFPDSQQDSFFKFLFGIHPNVPQVSFMQFFSPYAGVFLGKLDTTSGDANEFAHGKGDTQFLNLAFNINPVAVVTAPYSTLGAGLIILPTKDPKAAIINFMVLQSNGQTSTAGFEDLHSNQLTFAGEARVRTNFFGLTGHQLIGAEYSNKSFTSLDQSVRFLLENRTFEKQKGSWVIYYNFDQYLYETEKGSGKGVGIFGRSEFQTAIPTPCTSSSVLESAARASFPVVPSTSLV